MDQMLGHWIAGSWSGASSIHWRTAHVDQTVPHPLVLTASKQAEQQLPIPQCRWEPPLLFTHLVKKHRGDAWTSSSSAFPQSSGPNAKASGLGTAPPSAIRSPRATWEEGLGRQPRQTLLCLPSPILIQWGKEFMLCWAVLCFLAPTNPSQNAVLSTTCQKASHMTCLHLSAIVSGTCCPVLQKCLWACTAVPTFPPHYHAAALWVSEIKGRSS